MENSKENMHFYMRANGLTSFNIIQHPSESFNHPLLSCHVIYCRITRQNKNGKLIHPSVGGTSTSFGQFSYLCPKKPEGPRRSSDLNCPIRKNYELAQKIETECFQVLNMAFLAGRNMKTTSLLPDMLWQYRGEVWLLEILKFMCYC